MAFQGDSIYWVEVDKVVPNPFQPRLDFDEKKLQELAESIRMYGVLQPLTVSRSEVQREDGTFYTEYEIIAGERRLRASKIAGVAQVPVIIREGEQSEQEKLELAIIENLQREDLNVVDRALAFRQLADNFGLSHVQVAKKMGRSREYVSNSIRLLNLPSHMLDSLKRGDMMEGHARTLLMLTDRPEEQEVVYKETLLKKLSVREVERIVRKIASDKVRKKTPEFDGNLIELEKKFTETLGTRVQIQKTDFGGKLTIDYFSENDLAVILQKVSEDSQQINKVTQEGVDKISSHTALQVDSPSSEDVETTDSSVVNSEPIINTVVEDKDFVNQPKEAIAITEETSPKESFVAKSETPYNSTVENKDFVNQSEENLATEESVEVNHYPFTSIERSDHEEAVPLDKTDLVVEKPVSEESKNNLKNEVGEMQKNPNALYEQSSETKEREFPQPEEEIASSDSDDSDLYSIKNFGV